MSSLVLIYGNPSLQECVENIRYVQEVYEEFGPFAFLFQGEKGKFESLVKMHSDLKFCFAGGQARTIDELIVLFSLKEHRIKKAIDCITDDVWDFDTEERMVGIRQLLSAFHRLAVINPMQLSSGEVVRTAREAAGELAHRASSVSQVLVERIEWYSILMRYEYCFARGHTKISKGGLASAGILEASKKNGFDDLIRWYRDLKEKAVFDVDIINGRLDVLIALSADMSLSGKSQICRYLLVQSAYFFSLGKTYNSENEANAASLLFFRSFELLAWVIGLRKRILEVEEDKRAKEFHVAYASGVRDRKDNELGRLAVQGVGQLWGVFRNYGVCSISSVATGLTAFGTMRNKSILGHGFFHISSEAANDAQKEIVRLVEDALDRDDASFWMHYKYVSRGVRLDKFGVPNEVGILQ